MRCLPPTSDATSSTASETTPSGPTPNQVKHLIPDKPLVLLRHEREWCGGLGKWVAQHGHRSRLWARATVSLRRMVAMEFGACRSGRIGGAAGSITCGKVNRFELRGGRS